MPTALPYKILWFSFLSLHDRSNGAAISCKIILEQLRQRGLEVKALTALASDSNTIPPFFQKVESLQSPEAAQKPFYQFTENGIEYFVQKTQAHSENSLTSQDINKLFDLYCQLLEKYQPDLVMGYSGHVAATAFRQEARARGIKNVYALCNGYHLGYNFPACDLVFTNSHATARLYRDRDGTKVKATGNFIDKKQVLAPPRKRLRTCVYHFNQPGPQQRFCPLLQAGA